MLMERESLLGNHPYKEENDMTGIQKLVFAAVLLLAFAGEAHAYIDPGTGSYIIQIVIGGVLAALFALKVYWARVKLFFSGLRSKKPKNDKAKTNEK
jgi:hypothetical protein